MTAQRSRRLRLSEVVREGEILIRAGMGCRSMPLWRYRYAAASCTSPLHPRRALAFEWRSGIGQRQGSNVHEGGGWRSWAGRLVRRKSRKCYLLSSPTADRGNGTLRVVAQDAVTVMTRISRRIALVPSCPTDHHCSTSWWCGLSLSRCASGQRRYSCRDNPLVMAGKFAYSRCLPIRSLSRLPVETRSVEPCSSCCSRTVFEQYPAGRPVCLSCGERRQRL